MKGTKVLRMGLFVMCGMLLAFQGAGMAGADKPPIKVGVVLPLSGGFEIYGNLGIQGAKMAVAEINAAGGVLGGRKFELVIEDNKTDPKTAVEKTEKVILRDKVIAVMGPVSSAARDAMTPVVTKHKTPLLYGIDYEGGACSRYLFCYSPIPDHYIKPLIPYLSAEYGKSFYVFGYDYVWPHKMAEAIDREVKAVGGEIKGVTYTPFGVKDFAPTIQKIAQSGAKVLMLILPGADGFTFIKQFTEFGLKKKIKLVAIASEENYLSALTPEQSEGITTCLQFVSSMDKPDTKSFVARQKNMFGEKTVVTYAAESHYGLIMLLKKAIEKTNSDDKEKVIDAMGDLTLTVGNGPVTMRKMDHHMILNMVIAEFTGGKLVAKKDIGPISPADQCAGKKQ